MSEPPPTRSVYLPDQDRRLVHALAVALRTASLYEPGNAAVNRVVADVVGVLHKRLLETDEVTVTTLSNCAFVGDERLHVGPSDYLNVRYLAQLFSACGIGGVRITSGVRAEEIRALLYALHDAEGVGLERARNRLKSLGVLHIRVLEPVSESPRSADTAHTPLRTYSACVQACREMQDAVESHRNIRTRRLRRVTQTVVDQVTSDTEALLTMATVKEFDDYLFTHSANVSILSVALGQRIGLSKRMLGELCLAAFLHDLGKVLVPRNILDKEASLNEEEWETMRHHPVYGVSLLLQREQLNRSALRAMIAGYEHHLNIDLTGYPRVQEKRNVTVFGRIISIADRYDAYTAPRAYRSPNHTPYEGIAYLLRSSGKTLDPVLVRLFVEMLGLYPPGTVLRLSTGQVVVVHRPPAPGSPVDRPHARVLGGAESGSILDLASRRADGNFAYQVDAVLNPDNNGYIPAVDPEELSALEGTG